MTATTRLSLCLFLFSTKSSKIPTPSARCRRSFPFHIPNSSVEGILGSFSTVQIGSLLKRDRIQITSDQFLCLRVIFYHQEKLSLKLRLAEGRETHIAATFFMHFPFLPPLAAFHSSLSIRAALHLSESSLPTSDPIFEHCLFRED